MTVAIKPLLADDFPPLLDLYPWPNSAWIRANFIQSLNGKVTDKSGDLYLSSVKDKFLFRYLRATADCILIGRQTALNQPYKKVQIAEKYSELRHTQAPLRIAIISNSLNFTSGYFEGFSHKPLLITNKIALENHQDILHLVEPIELGESRVNLKLLKTELIKRSLNRVLCEGGPELITQLVNFDLLDEIDLTVSHQIKSADERSLFTGNLTAKNEDSFYFQQILYDDKNLFLRIIKK